LIDELARNLEAERRGILTTHLQQAKPSHFIP
jgi:hypothetical protein